MKRVRFEMIIPPGVAGTPLVPIIKCEEYDGVLNAFDYTNEPTFHGVMLEDTVYNTMMSWKKERTESDPNIVDHLFLHRVALTGLWVALMTTDESGQWVQAEMAHFDYVLPNGYVRAYVKPKLWHNSAVLTKLLEDRRFCQEFDNCLIDLSRVYPGPMDHQLCEDVLTFKAKFDFSSNWDQHFLSFTTESIHILCMQLYGTLVMNPEAKLELRYQSSMGLLDVLIMTEKDVITKSIMLTDNGALCVVESVIDHNDIAITKSFRTLYGKQIEECDLRSLPSYLSHIDNQHHRQMSHLRSAIEATPFVQYHAEYWAKLPELYSGLRQFTVNGMESYLWLMRHLIERIEKIDKIESRIEISAIKELVFDKVKAHIAKWVRYESNVTTRLVAILDAFAAPVKCRSLEEELVDFGFRGVLTYIDAVLKDKTKVSPHEAHQLGIMIQLDGPWFNSLIDYAKQKEIEGMTDVCG